MVKYAPASTGISVEHIANSGDLQTQPALGSSYGGRKMGMKYCECISKYMVVMLPELRNNSVGQLEDFSSR